MAASTLALVAVCGRPAPVEAQTAGQSAEAFAEAMAKGVEEIDLSHPPANILALAGGYYRLVVTRAADTRNDIPIDCDKSLNQLTGAKKIADILTGNTRDVGISLELPVKGQKAELNLFRLNKLNGSNCRVEQSYFALRTPKEAFETPWMPLEVNPRAGGEFVEIRFRPWSIQTPNAERVSALWSGVGAFAKFLGPIGTLGSMLLGKQGEDPYAIRAQAKASFFEKTGLDASTDTLAEAQNFRRQLRIFPDKNGTTPLNRVTATWALPGKKAGSIGISYSVDVEYQASRILDEKTFRTVQDTELSKIIAQNSPTGDSWSSITPSVSNLERQKSPESFSAACVPADTDLKNLNLSEPDRMFLLYAIARKNFTRDKFHIIECLSGVNARMALGRFGLYIPGSVIINTEADKKRTAGLLAAALGQPAGLGSGPEEQRLGVVIKSPVSVSVSPTLAMSGDQKFADGMLSAADFLARFRKIAFLNATGCQVTIWSSGNMPPSSGLDSVQQPVAFLGRQGQAIFLVVAGLATKVNGPDDLPPEITALFITDNPAGNDPAIIDIRKRMTALDAASCAKDSTFSAFFAPPPETPPAPPPN